MSMLGTVAVAQLQISPKPVPPPAILNEILFDAGGVDGTGDYGEYIEILVLRDNTNLGSLGFENASGQALARFPAVVAAKGSIVVMSLGPKPLPQLDADVSDKSAGFCNRTAPGDYLGNTSGGVRLKDYSTNQVIDAFYWGTGVAPSGTQVGPWGAGQFYDVSAATGRPVNEGESVGRNAHSTNYPGGPADWSPHGGAVAPGPSPGRRNDLLEVYPNDLLSWAQGGVNEVLEQYSDMQLDPGRYSVTGASVAAVAVTFPSETEMRVSANHTFTIVASGVPSTYSGPMTATLTIDPVVATLGYTLELQGTLTAARGNSLTLHHLSRYGGFTAGPRRVDYNSEVTLSESGFDQWFDIQGHMTLVRNSDNQWTWSDARNGTDYTDPNVNVVNAVNVITRLGDGHLHSVFTIDRPDPSGPTFAGQADQHMVLETDSIAHGDGTIQAQIVRCDQDRNGQPYLSLIPGQTGSFTVARTMGASSQTFSAAFVLPAQHVGGAQQTLTSFANGTVQVANGKYVMSGVRGHSVNGFLLGESQFFVDPPLAIPMVPQSGSGNTITGNNNNNGNVNITNNGGTVIVVVVQSPSQTPPPQPAPTTGGSGYGIGGLGAATVACAAAGAAMGAGGGTVALPVIGTVSGGVGGGIIGGVVCGGTYALAWIFDW